jgi:hypothetical protein
MRSLIGIISLLIFLAIAYVAAGSWIDEQKAKMSKCTDTRAALGLCK